MILEGLENEYMQCPPFLVEKLRSPKQEHRLGDSINRVSEPSMVVPLMRWHCCLAKVLVSQSF